MVSAEDGSLETNGWAERALIHALAEFQDGKMVSRAVGMQDVHPRLMEVATTLENPSPEDESVYMTGNRAFHKLHEKGLVENVTEATNLEDDRYLVDSGYAPADARRTEWVLTDAGFDELHRLDARYRRELAALQRRFGRTDTIHQNRTDV